MYKSMDDCVNSSDCKENSRGADLLKEERPNQLKKSNNIRIVLGFKELIQWIYFLKKLHKTSNQMYLSQEVRKQAVSNNKALSLE